MTEYGELLVELRHRYEKKYHKPLDDEILYLIIRINELQVDLKKDIRNVRKPVQYTSKEHFFYGLGRVSHYSILIGIALLLAFSIFLNYKSPPLPYSNKTETAVKNVTASPPNNDKSGLSLKNREKIDDK